MPLQSITSAPLQVNLLGNPQIIVEGFSVSLSYRKLTALLSYLLIEHKRIHPRSELIDLIWPDQDLIKARQNLRKALHELKKQIKMDELGFDLWNTYDEEIVVQDQASVRIDLIEVERAINQVKNHQHPQLSRCPTCLTQLEQVIDLYRDDFMLDFSLPDNDVFENWMRAIRLDYHGQVVSACEMLVEAYWLRSELKKSVKYLQKLLILEPAHELAAMRQLRYLADADRFGEAIDFFRRFRDHLAADLDVLPEPALERMAARIRLRRRPGVSGLPALHPSFIGREKELSWINQQVLSSDERAVLLVGQRGVGKTTLAVQAAQTLGWRFYDGVQFVYIGHSTTPESVFQAISSVLEIKTHLDTSAEDELIQFLQSKNMLLVIDACENALSGASRLVERVRTGCPEVYLILTSRAQIPLVSSTSVQNLTLRNLSPEKPLMSLSVDALSTYQAAELFIERCLAIQPGFTIDSTTAPALAQICHWLMGNPLAIELVAGQARNLGLINMRESLSPVLSSGLFDLQAIMNWVYARLDQFEQKALRRCCILKGHWAVEAAEAVISENLPQGKPSRDLIEALVLQNLIKPAGDERYQLLDTIQEFGQTQLEQTGELDRVQRHHLDYFAAYIENGLAAPRASYLIAEFTACDLENIRSAVQFALKAGQADVALGILARVWHYWDYHGPFTEFLDLSNKALAATKQPHPLSLCQIRLAQGVFFHYLGRKEENWSAFQDALTLSKSNRFYYETARTLRLFGQVATIYGQLDQARAYLMEALEVLKEAPDAYLQSMVYGGLGTNAGYRGDIAEVEAMLEKALLFSEASIDPIPRLGALCDLARTRLIQHRFEESKALYEEALPLALKLKDSRVEIAICLGLSLYYHGQNQFGTAKDYIFRALRINLDVRESRMLIYCMEYLLQVFLSQGQLSQAAMLYSAAQRLRGRTGFSALRADEQERHAGWVKDLKQGLGEAKYAECLSAGESLAMEQVMEMIQDGER